MCPSFVEATTPKTPQASKALAAREAAPTTPGSPMPLNEGRFLKPYKEPWYNLRNIP